VIVKEVMLGNNVKRDCWSWRRNLFVWEERFKEECKVLLTNISLHDRWMTLKFETISVK